MNESDQLSHVRLESCNGVPDGGVFVGRRRCGRHEGRVPAEAISQRPPPAYASSMIEHDAAGDAEQPHPGPYGIIGQVVDAPPCDDEGLTQ